MFLAVNKEKTPSEIIVVFRGWELWNTSTKSLRTKREKPRFKTETKVFIYLN